MKDIIRFVHLSRMNDALLSLRIEAAYIGFRVLPEEDSVIDSLIRRTGKEMDFIRERETEESE